VSYDSYEALIEEVSDEVGRSDVKAKMLDWLDLIEKRMVRELKYFRGSVFQTTGTLTADQASLTLPTGLLEALLLRIETNPEQRVNMVSWDKLVDVRASGASAGLLTVEVAHHFDQYTLLLEPAPSSNDPYTLFWRGQLPKIDETTVTSQVLEEAPDLLFHGALFHAFGYTRNAQQKAENKGLYDQCLDAYGKFLWNAHFGGGTNRVRPDSMPAAPHTQQYTTP
jgi:hypothetical protein